MEPDWVVEPAVIETEPEAVESAGIDPKVATDFWRMVRACVSRVDLKGSGWVLQIGKTETQRHKETAMATRRRMGNSN